MRYPNPVAAAKNGAAFDLEMKTQLTRAREEVAILEEAQAKALARLGDVLGLAGLTGHDAAKTVETGGQTLPFWVCVAATYADAIRDALAPFDSGIRQSEDKAA
jgi:hypothetical protein